MANNTEYNKKSTLNSKKNNSDIQKKIDELRKQNEEQEKLLEEKKKAKKEQENQKKLANQSKLKTLSSEDNNQVQIFNPSNENIKNSNDLKNYLLETIKKFFDISVLSSHDISEYTDAIVKEFIPNPFLQETVKGILKNANPLKRIQSIASKYLVQNSIELIGEKDLKKIICAIKQNGDKNGQEITINFFDKEIQINKTLMYILNIINQNEKIMTLLGNNVKNFVFEPLFELIFLNFIDKEIKQINEKINKLNFCKTNEDKLKQIEEIKTLITNLEQKTSSELVIYKQKTKNEEEEEQANFDNTSLKSLVMSILQNSQYLEKISMKLDGYTNLEIINLALKRKTIEIKNELGNKNYNFEIKENNESTAGASNFETPKTFNFEVTHIIEDLDELKSKFEITQC